MTDKEKLQQRLLSEYPEWFRYGECAILVGFSVKWIRNQVKERRLHSELRGGTRVVGAPDMRRFMQFGTSDVEKLAERLMFLRFKLHKATQMTTEALTNRGPEPDPDVVESAIRAYNEIKELEADDEIRKRAETYGEQVWKM
jgi:hypothetical protein